MEKAAKRLGPDDARKDWEKRIAARTELAKRAGAHVLVPTSNVTRLILQISQQMDALYQQLTQKSGVFGTIKPEKRMEVEQLLADHLIGMSLTAEKMADVVGGRARYFPPRELERYHKKQPKKKPASEQQQAAEPATPGAKPATAVKAAKKTTPGQAIEDTPGTEPAAATA